MKISGMYNEWLDWAKQNRAANTVESQRSAIRGFIKSLTPGGRGNPDMMDIKSADVMNFVNCKTGRSVSLGQRKFRLNAIKGFLGLAKEYGHVKRNHAAKLRVDMTKLSHKQKEKRVKRVLDEDEYKCIMMHGHGSTGGVFHRQAPTFFTAATAISYWTGLRLMDIATLEWDVFMSEPGHIVVWTAKAGDNYHARVALPMSDPLIGSGALTDVLNALPFNCPTYVFPAANAIAKKKSRATLPQYYKRWVNNRHGAGNFLRTPISFHCLRHTFVTRLADAGKTLGEIGKLVAHTDESTTKGYVHKT
jgi:integrase